MIVIKYFWIVTLVVLFIIWTIHSFARLIYCIRTFKLKYVFSELDESSQLYFIVIIGAPTLASFLMFVLG